MTQTATERPRRIVLGISGASGAPYARRLLQRLTEPEIQGGLELSVVLSATARTVWAQECEGQVEDFGIPVFGGRDYHAPFASGSSCADAMVILPCSMSCVARVAHGMSDNLLTRAADVVLKERRRLILVPRETPYSSIHLRNLLELSQAGALVLPASPSFYARPSSVEDILDSVVGRVLDHLDITHASTRRWGQDITPED